VREAGAVVIGKTVTTELAYFTPGPTANPCNPAHTPGGSSSGSAAAVADGMVPLALGTPDSGLVDPAGVLLRRVRAEADLRHGRPARIKPFAPSLDTLGWFGRAADDLELMRCVLQGEPFSTLHHPRALVAAHCRLPHP
jgi:Asp-tRNA(Asn)/Glu-tRNA(Gln) amidotransferase A subunit family amidase